jgi:small subunit ribosomal protein S6
MRQYETIYIINPNLDGDSVKEVVTKFSDLITKLKGYIVSVNEWGKRKLAYEVNRFDRGYYVVLNFCGLPGVVKELERGLKLDDRVLHYLTVKINEDVDSEDLAGTEQEQEETAQEEPTESGDRGE